MTEHLALTMFVRHYPLTFHVSLCPVPDLLLSNGLFSAAGLLELTASSEEQCKILLESQRQTTLRVLTGFGPAIINDQLPLPDKALAGCLTGMLPREWCKELNERFFFFLTQERALQFARVQMSKLPQKILVTLSTERLIRGREDAFELCHFNSGNALRKAAPRGRNSFIPIASYPLAERITKFGRARAVAEMSIRVRHLPLVDSFISTSML
jgi:hypothetical protein